MPRPAVPLVAALSMLLAAPAGAETIPAEARFELWNDCRSMDLVVESATGGAADIGLTGRAIAVAVRGRLGAAGVYDPEALAYLHVHASAVGPAFHFNIEYMKWLNDPASGEEGAAATWISGSSGTHGGGSDYVLASISEHVDRFIERYRRVNAEACKR